MPSSSLIAPGRHGKQASGAIRGEDSERLEIDLLLSGIRDRYGYDFTHYSRASLLRRLAKARDQAKAKHFTELRDKLLDSEKSFDEFLKAMSITVTNMFRDPEFYQELRAQVVPVLKTFPFIKIWHAGCATGEEVYSMAILLHEVAFLERSQIYATNFNKHSLDMADNVVYPISNIESFFFFCFRENNKKFFSSKSPDDISTTHFPLA